MQIRRSIIAALSVTAFASGAYAQTMKAADVHPAGYPTVVAVEHLGQKLEAATQGRIKFQMFPGSVLGGEKEMIEQTQVGAIQILRTSLGPVGPTLGSVSRAREGSRRDARALREWSCAPESGCDADGARSAR